MLLVYIKNFIVMISALISSSERRYKNTNNSLPPQKKTRILPLKPSFNPPEVKKWYLNRFPKQIQAIDKKQFELIGLINNKNEQRNDNKAQHFFPQNHICILAGTSRFLFRLEKITRT